MYSRARKHTSKQSNRRHPYQSVTASETEAKSLQHVGDRSTRSCAAGKHVVRKSEQVHTGI